MNFQTLKLNNNTLDISASGRVVTNYFANELAVSDVDTVEIIGNTRRSTTHEYSLFDETNANNFQSFTVSGNTLTTTGSGSTSWLGKANFTGSLDSEDEKPTAKVIIDHNTLSGSGSAGDTSSLQSLVNLASFEYTNNITRGQTSVGGMFGIPSFNNVESAVFSGNESYTGTNPQKNNSVVYGSVFDIRTSAVLDGVRHLEFSNNKTGGTQDAESNPLGLAYSAYGGVASNYASTGSRLTLADNETLTISGNSARAAKTAQGGAFHSSYFTISGIGQVSITGNKVQTLASGEAAGGAFYAKNNGSENKIEGNGTVTIANNAAEAMLTVDGTETGGSAGGGAIYAANVLIAGNQKVTLTGNHIAGSSVWGGGILATSTLTIDEKDFTSRGNYLTNGTIYRLNGLYSGTSSAGTMKLCSQGDDGLVAIYDGAIATGELTFNGREGATGTVVLSGAYAQKDLAKLTPDYTESDLAFSRSTSANSIVIAAGTVSLQDKAILKAVAKYQSLKMLAGATLAMRDASLRLTGRGDIAGTMSFQGQNTVDASSINMLADSTLVFRLGESPDTPLVQINGSLSQKDTLHVNINGRKDQEDGVYALVQATSAFSTSKWTQEKVSVTSNIGSGFSDLSWDGGNLYLAYTAPETDTLTWNNWTEDGQWSLTSANWEAKDHQYRKTEGRHVYFTSDNAGSVNIVGAQTAKSIHVNNEAGRNISFDGSGSITGTTSLTKEGAGALSLNTANSYIGGTSIRGGVLYAGNRNALGSGAVHLSGGTLNTNNTSSLSLTSLTLGGGTLATIPGTITVKDTLTISGDTVIDLGTYTTGDFTVLVAGSLLGSTDLLTLSNSSAEYTWSYENNALVLHIGEVEDPFEPTPDPTPNDDVVITSNNSVYLDTPISGTGGLKLIGKGTVTLLTPNSYTGGTTINDGALVIVADGALGDGSVTLNKGMLAVNGHDLSQNVLKFKDTAKVSGGTEGRLASLDLGTPGILDRDGSLLFGGEMTLSGSLKVENLNAGMGNIKGGAVEVTQTITASAGTISANLSGAASFTKSGRGTVTLKGRNSWTGSTTLNGGKLVIAGQSSLTSLTINGGTLAITAGGSLSLNGLLALANAATLDFTGNATTIALGSIDSLLEDFLTGNGYSLTENDGSLILAEALPVHAAADNGPVAMAAEEPVPAVAAAPTAPAPAAAVSSLAQGTWGAARAARLFTQTVADHEGAGSTALDASGTRSAWFSTMGGFSRTSSHGMAAGADADILGGVLGMQFNGSKGGNIGLAIGQTWGRISPTDGGASVTQKAQHAALYGSKTLVNREHDRVGVSATAAYSTTDSDTTQNGHGFDWTQQGAVLGLRGTWEHAVSGATSVYGYLGTEYLATNSGRTENGQSGSVQDWKVELGAGARHTAGKLTVYADAAFAPSLVRHNPVAESDGTRGGASNPGRLEIHANAGAAYRLNEHWNLHAGYSYEGAARENSHNVRAGATYTF